ncbi:hypothetical protein LWI29_035235 [Acer saccharum]|uniref:X8 domain-containing protein n=1 Tax=Acer saccharum TaxID=4024 RepID=A0AA39RTJ6_ACESA|nr:hypothetical protein LWI29_035235 [Acer saccharum]
MFSSSALIANLDYACSQVDCSSIQQGGSCFYPNTEIHHASFAMNLHYQTLGRHISDCDFRSSGLISLTDPRGDLAEEGAPLVMQNGTWCVAKPGTRDDLLQQNINYACNNVDCSPSTDDGGSCYNPTTLINHASFAMNLYYQSMGRKSSSCNFKQTGLIVMTNPSKMREFVLIFQRNIHQLGSSVLFWKLLSSIGIEELCSIGGVLSCYTVIFICSGEVPLVCIGFFIKCISKSWLE